MKIISTCLIALIAIVVVVIFTIGIGEKDPEFIPAPEITPSPLLPIPDPEPLPGPEITAAFVYRVIDGDTIVLQDGERVRLLGIDTPEKGEQYYEAARDRLKDLIERKTVRLERDVEDKDRFGRLLRYVFINDTFVNIYIYMVREGYASVFIIYPNIKYSSKFEDAEEEARAVGEGLWRISGEADTIFKTYTSK